jgi:signal transduction histidine kinase
MSLGLPGHLAPHSESRAFARASHVIALVCLLAALVLLFLLQEASPGVILWPSMLALVPMLAALWALERYRTWYATAGFLIVGTASIYWFVLAGTAQFPGTAVTDSYVLTLPKIALIMVAGSGTGVLRMIGWCLLGGALGEAATVAAAAQTGATVVVDGTALSVVGVVVAVLSVIGVNRARVRHAQPSLARAARDEQLSGIRRRIEARAAAMMHDTILGHLAAIASEPDGPLREDLQRRIDDDLAVLVGQEWLVDAEADADGWPGGDAEADGSWVASRMLRAIDEARDLGLEVVLSGDLSSVARLTPARDAAVALATKQCLVNVLGHAEVTTAEVVVYGAKDELSVMVIDSGRGFSERETGLDRLGLRQSVRRRIEAVDGTVQVWSTPGAGTSVLIRVPALPKSEATR